MEIKQHSTTISPVIHMHVKFVLFMGETWIEVV